MSKRKPEPLVDWEEADTRLNERCQELNNTDYICPRQYQVRHGPKLWMYATETQKIYYAPNQWKPDEDPRTKSECVFVGLDSSNGTVIVAPEGNDVHHHEMDLEQLTYYIEMLEAFRDFLEETTGVTYR